MIPIWHLMGRFGNQMFQYAYLYSQWKSGNIPDIYVQGEEFFEEHKDEIKSLFSSGIDEIDMVSIHVRRGDYVDNPFYVDLFETGYYEEAMLQFPEADFLIFSDDIEWCKDQAIFAGCEFSEGRDEVADMNLMASCRGHIIANSSFSWWAAYLGGGKTIAPKIWFTDGVERTKLLKEWITL